MMDLYWWSLWVLGGLAFFEPCTIATHTMLAAQCHRAGGRERWKPLLSMWLSRLGLLALLLLLLLLLLPPIHWGREFKAGLLLFLAVVYIVSRFRYLPIPHLELFRIWPGGQNLPLAIRLGWTLPACTLPLFGVVAAITLSVHTLAFALLAAAIFGTLFSLPVIIFALMGLRPSVRRLLTAAAQLTPFLTAMVLLGAALYEILPPHWLRKLMF